MWSGGFSFAVPTDPAGAQRVREEIVRKSEEAAKLSTTQRDKQHAQTDKELELRKTREKMSREEGEEVHFRAQDRSRQESAKQAAETVVSNRESLLKRLDDAHIEHYKALSQCNLALTTQYFTWMQITSAFQRDKAAMEQEQRQHEGECFRVMLAHSQNAAAKTTGTSARYSTELGFANYYRGEGYPPNQGPQQMASAMAMLDESNRRVDSLNQQLADPFYTNLAAKKQAEFVDARQTHEKQRAAAAQAKSGERVAESAWRGAVKASDVAADAVNESQRKQSALNQGLLAYADNEAKRTAERQKQIYAKQGINLT
jgi:hypothetical protein